MQDKNVYFLSGVYQKTRGETHLEVEYSDSCIVSVSVFIVTSNACKMGHVSFGKGKLLGVHLARLAFPSNVRDGARKVYAEALRRSNLLGNG